MYRGAAPSGTLDRPWEPEGRDTMAELLAAVPVPPEFSESAHGDPAQTAVDSGAPFAPSERGYSEVEGIWERRRIEDLRVTCFMRGVDIAPLDALLAAAGDPLTRTGRLAKREGETRRGKLGAAAAVLVASAVGGSTEGAVDGAAALGNKRQHAGIADEYVIPAAVQGMSVPELRVRFRAYFSFCLLCSVD